jgi:hypothetical protein
MYKNLFRTWQETLYVSATETIRLMLFRETIAVYLENHTEHTDTVRTSQERHYVSATELMLFAETVAVYCENHTEHTDTVRTSQEMHYVSSTEPNRLMLLVVKTVRNTQGRMQGFCYCKAGDKFICHYYSAIDIIFAFMPVSSNLLF